MGRNWAGVNYRSDITTGYMIGEEAAICFLEDQVNTLSESFNKFFFHQVRRYAGYYCAPIRAVHRIEHPYARLLIVPGGTAAKGDRYSPMRDDKG